MTSQLRRLVEELDNRNTTLPSGVRGLISIREPVEVAPPIVWTMSSDNCALQKCFSFDHMGKLAPFVELVVKESESSGTHASMLVEPPHVTVSVMCSEHGGASERAWYLAEACDACERDVNDGFEHYRRSPTEFSQQKADDVFDGTHVGYGDETFGIMER